MYIDIEWTKTSTRLPPNGLIVQTKIDDPINGVRNLCYLIRYGNEWCVPFEGVAVLYVPTHWRA